ncbi:MAG: CvpA family protein [Bacteroidales bacterium]|jgi:membrane protein required for colicin V production|nr:CvpA family protein [Bacteroidales bacterium]
MNTLDIVILLLFIPGIIRGLSKGFLEQAISLVGVVLSVYLAYHFSDFACNIIKQYITVSETVLNVIGFAVVLVVVLLLVMLLSKLVTKVAEMASLGWLNKVLGIVFALGTTALVIAILIILFDTVNVKFELVKSNILQDSVLYGHLKDFGYFVFPYLKQLLMKAS